ncbi:MAG: SRPBCC family protein [Acidimicrobiales bacterium]
MDPNFYSFRSEWPLAAPAGDVFLALSALGDYPSWWPEVRTVRPVSEDSAELVCRSFLPYELVFTSRQSRIDRDAGILEAVMEGDLAGFSRWTITPAGAGTLAVFEEQVTADKALLRRFARIARPAFQANHAIMMRHGRQGA